MEHWRAKAPSVYSVSVNEREWGSAVRHAGKLEAVHPRTVYGWQPCHDVKRLDGHVVDLFGATRPYDPGLLRRNVGT